jgi:single-stranded DNA-binding protein
MYDNSVRLIGFLGQNAEKRTARNKTPYVILNSATTVRWRAKESQEHTERTEWHRLMGKPCQVRRHAETWKPYLSRR